MQAMDVFVLASHNEPFGMVVIEAMALGKPVVATAEGGPTEVITSEEQGTLVPWGDPRALSRAVARFVADEVLESLKAVCVGPALCGTLARRRRHSARRGLPRLLVPAGNLLREGQSRR